MFKDYKIITFFSFDQKVTRVVNFYLYRSYWDYFSSFLLQPKLTYRHNSNSEDFKRFYIFIFIVIYITREHLFVDNYCDLDKMNVWHLPNTS